MITESEFLVLRHLMQIGEKKQSQRDISSALGISLGKTNKLLKSLRSSGYIADTGLTKAGKKILSQFKVKNAVIMAAGMSSRFAPLSYEKPKALLSVKGEILIERQIRQLKEAGIDEIYVVVGYMKEKMYYLAEKFKINIVINEDYYRYNNTSSLMAVIDKLSNTYICSSDNYFLENVFEKYVYKPYYSAAYADGSTEEYCIRSAADGRITDVKIGGENSWYMIGHTYWDEHFSKEFASVLKKSYDESLTRSELWEKLYIRNIKKLSLYIRKYHGDVIKEFDSLDELRKFDSDYIENTDSEILINIGRVLCCDISEIINIEPINSGLTNTSFKFECRKKRYVYRHPGAGTSRYINRRSEAASMDIAKKLKLDNTYIYMDASKGWKISLFVDNACEPDYRNEGQVKKALKLIKKLHESGEKTKYNFDIWSKIEDFYKELEIRGRDKFTGEDNIKKDICKLRRLADKDKSGRVICHVDCYKANFLIDEKGKFNLIDWEYSGMADPAVDIGTFIACSPYDVEEIGDILKYYLGRRAKKDEYRHYIAYVAFMSYYWFVWSLYQDSVGKPVGEWQYIWYKYTISYLQIALELYRK